MIQVRVRVAERTRIEMPPAEVKGGVVVPSHFPIA